MSKEARELARMDGGREHNDSIVAFFAYLKNRLFDPRNTLAQAFANFMLKDKTAEVFFHPGSSNEKKRLIIQAVLWLFKHYEPLLQRFPNGAALAVAAACCWVRTYGGGPK